MVTLNFSSIESKLLDSLKSIDSQERDFKKIKSVTALSDVDLKMQRVQREATACPTNSSLNSTREILTTFPFNKNPSKDLPLISKDYIANILFDLNLFNTKAKNYAPGAEELDTYVQKH